jgi:hypothetical protein
MSDVPIFDIPVYRTTKAAWDKEWEARRAKLEAAYKRNRPEGHKDDMRGFASFASLNDRATGYDIPRKFNQVAAWVRLIWNGPGPVIKGYAYRRRAERIQRMTTAPFDEGLYSNDKVVECWFFDDQSSEEMAAELRADLVAMGREQFPRGRSVDLTIFDNLAPYIDWRSLVGFEGPPRAKSE